MMKVPVKSHRGNEEMVAQRFVRSVLNALGKPFAKIGFKLSKDKLFFERRFSEDVIGLIGLNTIKWPKELQINPIVGMRNDALDRQVLMLMHEPITTLNAYAVQTNVGYLSPNNEYLLFEFAEGDECISNVADQLVEAVEAYGIPFMMDNMSLLTLLDNLHHNAIDHYSIYRIPVLLNNLGRKQESINFINDRIKLWDNRTDLCSVGFRQFAKHFLEQIEADMTQLATVSTCN